MLKALELAGFKSFADRTRFDFPDGITVVVGPNGSGKSNIVDAMKWVLGSQSAKSLRGKDMSDVIFKGSQTRGPAGSAEASIIFDNADGALPIDAPEVHVTRRVYRSGEGEYLINNQPVRLKDVRDLIRGTGIGIDAFNRYMLMQQASGAELGRLKVSHINPSDDVVDFLVNSFPQVTVSSKKERQPEAVSSR